MEKLRKMKQKSLTVGVPCCAIKTENFERISSKKLRTSGVTVSSNIRPTNSPFQEAYEYTQKKRIFSYQLKYYSEKYMHHNQF